MERKSEGGAPTAEEFKKVTGEIAKAFEEFKKTNEEALKKADSVTADKLRKIDEDLHRLSDIKADYDKRLKAADDRVDELEKKLNRRGGGNGDDAEKEAKAVAAYNVERRSVLQSAGTSLIPADIDVEGYRAYKAAQSQWLRKNANALTQEETKALAAGVQPDGGFLVTPDVSGRIVTRIFETSPIRQIAGQQTISTDRLKGLKDLDEAASGGWVSETGTRSTSATPQVGEWEIPVHEVFAQPAATQVLLEDAAVDVERWLADKVADKLARVENAAFINGTGVGQPRGFCDYTPVSTGDGSRSWGQLQYIPTGASGTISSADCLFDMIGAFKTGYLQNATWVTRREVVTLIRKLKDSQNRYLWEPSLQAGQPQMILGYPMLNAQDMPAVGANSLSAAFGDFGLGYQIVDRLGVTVLRDPFTNKPYVNFYTRKRVGGDVVQFEAIKLLKFSAS